MPHHQSPDAPVGVFGITHARFVFEPFLTIERAQFSAARSGMEISDPAVADAAPLEWSEEDIVFLHWRLLQEIANLALAHNITVLSDEVYEWMVYELSLIHI